MTVRTIRTLLVALAIALASILGGTAVASAHPGHTGHDGGVYTQYDENDQSWLTDQFEATLREMLQRYPEVGSLYFTADIIRQEHSAYAGAGHNGNGDHLIVIQERWAENPDAFVISVLEDIAAGYHPDGCAPGRLVAIHEFGHILSAARGDRVEQAVLDNLGTEDLSGLHGYGHENLSEAVATSFAAVHCGSATWLEQEIYNLLLTA